MKRDDLDLAGPCRHVVHILAAAALLSCLAGELRAAACAVGLAGRPVPVPEGGVTVSDAAGLDRALGAATGGGVIRLAPGAYGVLRLRTQFDAPVTIASADPADPACFSELILAGAANVTFRNIVFDYRFDGEPHFFTPFEVSDSWNVGFLGAVFDGDLARGVSPAADGYGTGRGLDIRGSRGITVEDSSFSRWLRAILMEDVTDLRVARNDIQAIRSDGMNFVDVYGAVIEENHVHDFRTSEASGDHGDMIQFWKTGERPASHDVVIQGNWLDVGQGDWTQSLFMGSGPAKSDPRFFYRNIVIENNSIIGNHTHGVTVSTVDGLTIRNNSLSYRFAGLEGGVGYPRIHVDSASRNVTVRDNIATEVVGFEGQRDWQVHNNRAP